MQGHSCFQATLARAFSCLACEVIQLGRPHLMGRQQQRPTASIRCNHDVTRHYGSRQRSFSGVGHSALRPTEPRTAAVPASLTDLPLDIINHIIHFLDEDSMLFLFRTCKQLRDSALNHAAFGGPHKQTALSIVADFTSLRQEQQDTASDMCSTRSACMPGMSGLSAASASRLLQLAAQPGREVVLIASASLPTGMTSQQMSLAVSSPELAHKDTDSSRRRSIMTQHMAAAWLLSVFEPWLPGPCHTLRNVSAIFLRDMALDHPMPMCIGEACPALKVYGLHNVVWPVQVGATNTRCWPHVRLVTLSDICHTELPLLLHPGSLPQLVKLHVMWSHEYSELQQALHIHCAATLGLCAGRFCDQLTELALEGVPWSAFILRNQDDVFTRLTMLTIKLPHKRSHFLSYDLLLGHIVRATPSLEQLYLDSIHLTQPHSHLQWLQLYHVRIDTFESNMLDTFACLPNTPKLDMVTIPCGTTMTDVEVGSDLLGDIVRAVQSHSVPGGLACCLRCLCLGPCCS